MYAHYEIVYNLYKLNYWIIRDRWILVDKHLYIYILLYKNDFENFFLAPYMV